MEAGEGGVVREPYLQVTPRRKSGLKLKQLYCVQQVMIEDKALGCENLQVFTMSYTHQPFMASYPAHQDPKYIRM